MGFGLRINMAVSSSKTVKKLLSKQRLHQHGPFSNVETSFHIRVSFPFICSSGPDVLIGTSLSHWYTIFFIHHQVFSSSQIMYFHRIAYIWKGWMFERPWNPHKHGDSLSQEKRNSFLRKVSRLGVRKLRFMKKF